MRTERFTCDQCGIEKGETNHWYIVVLPPLEGFNVYTWESGMPGKHVCGQNCASILLARWMATGKLDKPSVEG